MSGISLYVFSSVYDAHAIPLRLYGKVKIKVSKGVGLCNHHNVCFLVFAAKVRHFFCHANFLPRFLC